MKTVKIDTAVRIFALLSILISTSLTLVHAQNSLELEVPLLINSAFVGNINANITNTIENEESQTDVRIPVSRFKELALEFANDEQLEQWFGVDLAKQEPELSLTISLAELRNRGLEVAFDSGLLTVDAVIPRLGTQAISVRGGRPPVPSEHYVQSKIASGLNIVTRTRYNHEATSQQEKGFGDTNVDFSGFTSVGGFGGWSLFYEFDHLESRGDRKFQRRDITLIHDDYDRGLRYSFGDVRPAVSQFQTSPNILGVNIERNYSEINPFRNLRPSGRSTFTLDRESVVSFEVNGAIINTVELTPGTYSIEDFPLASGTNDVRVIIDDGTSRVEAANFSTYVDTTLLAQGITNFGITAGVQRDTNSSGSGIRYQDDAVLLGFYEKGIRRNLTVGAQAELGEDHALLASNAIFGLRVGVLAFNGAISKRDNHGSGFNSIVQYNVQRQTRSGWNLQTDIQATYQSDGFVSLGESRPGVEESTFNARTSFSKNGLNLVFGGGIREVNDTETKQLSATLSKSFKNFGVSLGYQYIKSDSSQQGSDSRFNISVSKRFGDARAQGRYKSNSNEFSAEWRSKFSRDLGAINSRVKAISSDTATGGELDVGYINSRFELDARHRSTSPKVIGSPDSSGTTITAAGAIGYADGSFAFGRPFRRGFAVVGAHKNLRGKKVSISRNSVRGQVISRTKTLRTTLIPVENSYRTQRFAFSVDDLPIGYDIGEGEVKVFPGYLAGYKVNIGSDAANTVIGRLVWPDGTKVSLTSGKLIGVDEVPVSIFTNRTGRFVAEKLKHGSYQLMFSSDDGEFHAGFEIEETPEPGLVQLEAITLEKVK